MMVIKLKRKILFVVLTIFMVITMSFVLGEILARIFIDPVYSAKDERNTIYRYDKELGWFPKEKSEDDYMGSRLIKVKNNDLGFRDINHGEKTKKRIAFVGDSFVWGYDVEQNERFTDKLQAKLPDFEIINMGISGYGTDQQLLLLKKWFDHFQPDIVFLVFCNSNDVKDNNSNIRYRGYYKPYFEISDNQLIKRGVPVPKGNNYYAKQYPILFKSRLIQSLYNYILPKEITLEYDPTVAIISEMKNYVTSKESEFYMAFTERIKCNYCDSLGIQPVHIGNKLRYKSHGSHWTPEGHDYVTSVIYERLIKENVVKD